MNTVTRNPWEENEEDSGLIPPELLDPPAFSLPEEEDSFVFCPECGEMADSFVFIEHKRWCPYGEPALQVEV